MPGPYALFFEFAVITSHRLLRFYFAVGDQAQHADECQGVLGIFNPSTEQGDSRAVLAGIGQEFESVVRGPAAASQYADDDGGIVGNKLFKRSRAEAGDFQKQRPS